MKICIGFNDIIGYGGGLHKGFSEIGVSSDVFYIDKSKMGLTNKESYNVFLNIFKRMEYIMCNMRYKLFKIPYFIISRVSLFLFYVWLPFKYDVFILLSKFPGYRFLLWWLKINRATVVVVFFGSDVRDPWYDQALLSISNNEDDIKVLKINNINFVKYVEKYADYIVSHPPISMLQHRPFLQYVKIGIPYDVESFMQHNNESSDVIRIVHAPSAMDAKGTNVIRKEIEGLKSKGYKIEYIELNGMPNKDVIDRIYHSDIVIDQLYADIPCSKIVVEASAFGKPVVVGTYYNFDKYNILDVEYPMIVKCAPDQLGYTLTRLINSPKTRKLHGDVSRMFMLNKWSCKEVASRYMRIIKGDIPDTFFYTPHDNTQYYGYGIPRKL